MEQSDFISRIYFLKININFLEKYQCAQFRFLQLYPSKHHKALTLTVS